MYIDKLCKCGCETPIVLRFWEKDIKECIVRCILKIKEAVL